MKNSMINLKETENKNLLSICKVDIDIDYKQLEKAILNLNQAKKILALLPY
ncbi:MAG: hypothetical protein LEGION0398_MBIBDBAK_01123 [Legionellaceae bacterium]